MIPIWQLWQLQLSIKWPKWSSVRKWKFLCPTKLITLHCVQAETNIRFLKKIALTIHMYVSWQCATDQLVHSVIEPFYMTRNDTSLTCPKIQSTAWKTIHQRLLWWERLFWQFQGHLTVMIVVFLWTIVFVHSFRQILRHLANWLLEENSIL